MHAPTVIEQSSMAVREAAAALWWRKNVMKMSRRELAGISGYSLHSIVVFEQGYRRDGRPLDPRAVLRYRNCCAGLTVLRGFALAGWPRDSVLKDLRWCHWK